MHSRDLGWLVVFFENGFTKCPCLHLVGLHVLLIFIERDDLAAHLVEIPAAQILHCELPCKQEAVSILRSLGSSPAGRHSCSDRISARQTSCRPCTIDLHLDAAQVPQNPHSHLQELAAGYPSQTNTGPRAGRRMPIIVMGNKDWSRGR